MTKVDERKLVDISHFETEELKQKLTVFKFDIVLGPEMEIGSGFQVRL